MSPKARPKLTEQAVLDLLRARHVRNGNGGSGEYAFMTHVRNGAGFNSNRTFDAIAMDLWPSRGLFLHAFEVKCSRSDWLRELKQPDKADDAFRLVDRFSIAAADDTIVQEGELPPTWGLFVVRGSKLVCVKEAPLLHDRTDRFPRIDRQFVVAMLRAGGAVPQAEAAEILSAKQQALDEARAELEERHSLDRQMATETITKLREQISDFERESGVSLRSWHGDRADAKEVGAALRAVLEGDARVKSTQRTLRDVRDQLREAAAAVDRFIDA